MKVDRFDIKLRWFITTLIYAIYIGMVFFTFRGNWSFLFTFDYYWTTASTTVLSIFLRWLYSDSGLEKELDNNTKIKAKEKSKGVEIQKVEERDLYDELKIDIDIKNQENKLSEYKTLCDTKIKYYLQKGWYKLFRKRKLQLWRDRKQEINTPEFNLDTIKIDYYKFDIDEMLSTFYKENKNRTRKRRTKNQKVVNSAKANFFTIVSIAILKGADLLLQDFTWEGLLILGGQLISFTLNIYLGIRLGKEFIKEDYSQNLTDDLVFLKTFLKKHKVVST